MADRSAAARLRRALSSSRTAAARLAADRRGVTMVWFALLLPVLLGGAGLGIDLGAAYSARQRVQIVADAAAMAAALELADGSAQAAVTSAATADATSNGLSASTDTLTLNTPPTSGTYAGDATAAEAVVTRTVPQILAPFVRGPSSVTVAARAVGRIVRASACVYSLAPSGTGVSTQGNANVTLPCGVYAASTGGQAISVGGSSCLRSTSISTPGGYSGTCLTPPPQTDAPVLGDPLGSLPQQSYAGGCDYTSKVHVTGSQTQTLSPGAYCGDIDVSGGTLTLQPGLYVMAGNSFSASGNAVITGSGVTLFFTGRTGTWATYGITAATLNLSAPTSGTYAGILIFQDRSAPTTTQDSIAGNGTLNLDGVVYAPTATLSFKGTSTSGQFPTLMVVRALTFVGNTSFAGSGGVSSGISGLPSVALVE